MATCSTVPVAILRDARKNALLTRNLGLWGGARPLGRANRPLISGCEWLDFDGIAKVFKALHQALGLRDLGTAVEMVGTEILVDGSVLEHVVDGGENGGGDGTDGFLWPAAAAQAQVLSLVIASLFVFGRLGTLNQGRLKPLRTFAQPVRSASPGALVVARTHASPRQQMSRGGEAAHVGANLGNNSLCAEVADTGVGTYDVDSGTKGREVGFDLAIHRPERGIEAIDLLQMELQQKAMMTCHSSAQCLRQLGLRRLHVGMRQCSEPDRAGLARRYGVEHRSPALAEHVGEFCIDLDVGVLKHLMDALDMTAPFAHQLLAGAQQGAQFLGLAVRDEACPNQAVCQEFRQPDGVAHVGLAPRHI